MILDPWGEVNRRYGAQTGVTEEITRFNPLSAIDPASKNFNDDVAAIADALVVAGHDKNSHWIESARELIAGLIAAAVETDPGHASLREVRELITASDIELIQYIQAIRKANPQSLAARKLRRFVRTNAAGEPVISEEIGSIRSTAETQTALLDSEILLDAMETGDPPFDLEELATGRVTLYLVLPPDRLNTHGRWLRMILTLALRTIARQPKPPAVPVLFILDEMGTIGALRMVEDSYGLLAGLGVRIAGYLQDLSQLKRDYPDSWETFISNSSIVGVLQCGDGTTAKYFSEYLGNGTIEVNQGWTLKTRPKDSRNPNHTSLGMSVLRGMAKGAAAGPDSGYTYQDDTKVERWEPDLSFHARPVLFPWEIRNSSPDKLIVIVPGKYNLRLQRFKYYSDPILSRWARHDPNKPTPQIEIPPPPPPPPTPTAGDRVADTAGKIGGFLKQKAMEKLAGK